MDNWFLWSGSYQEMVKEINDTISEVSRRKYGDTAIFKDAQAIPFSDDDIWREKIRKKL